jgi:hypothetical protein
MPMGTVSIILTYRTVRDSPLVSGGRHGWSHLPDQQPGLVMLLHRLRMTFPAPNVG